MLDFRSVMASAGVLKRGLREEGTGTLRFGGEAMRQTKADSPLSHVTRSACAKHDTTEDMYDAIARGILAVDQSRRVDVIVMCNHG
jgi:hypothetical protein